MTIWKIPRNGDRQETMDGEEAECPSEVHLAQRLASLMHRAFICSLVCAAHLAVIPVSSDGTTLAVEYYKACAEQEFDSHQNKSLSALRRSDVLVCVCFCVRVSADWRLGQADRSMRLRHLNSCELRPAIPLLQWLLSPRRFSIFPDRRSLGIWLSNQRGPAALLIYDLASQHSAGPIHHLHLGLFVVFTLPSHAGPLAVICCLSFNYSAQEELEKPAQLKSWD